MMKEKSLTYTPICILLILLVLNFKITNGFECNVCASSTGVACVSETQFQFCSTDGIPQGAILSCGANNVCSTLYSQYCLPNSTDVLKSCGGCNDCDENGVFACTGIRSFVLCHGGTTPTLDSGGSCASNYFCDVSSSQICVPSSTGTLPTCNEEDVTTTVEPSTTEAPITDAKTYCQNIQQARRFDAHDTNCKQYILCFVNGGIWNGQIYKCPGSTFYNDTTQMCGTTIPRRCVTTTTEIINESFNFNSSIISSPLASTIDTEAFCQNQQQIGRFGIGIGDGNCRQFISCFKNAGIWDGQQYFCPHLSYFDTSRQSCVKVKPVGCDN